MAGIYSYQSDSYKIYEERELHKLGEELCLADEIIGFNIRQFDLRVLQPYVNFLLDEIPTLDILVEIEKVLGHRISLDSLANSTLGVKKTGSGLMAIQLWKSGQIDALKSYCLNDVKLTKQLYDYGQQNRSLKYKDFFEVRQIPVFFSDPIRRTNVPKQSSLF